MCKDEQICDCEITEGSNEQCFCGDEDTGNCCECNCGICDELCATYGLDEAEEENFIHDLKKKE